MIEVLFGEGEAGSMKAARSDSAIISHCSNGPTTIGNSPINENDTITWIRGIVEEVICLGFMLDVGDIKQEVSSDYRKNLIFSLLYQEQWGKDSEMRKELLETGSVYVKELERLKRYIESGESIRIWYSKSPYSICGLYFLCNLIEKYTNEIYSVELPRHRISKDRIISYQNWGEVSAEEFSYFLKYQKKISMNERQLYAQNWRELVEDNSSLRVVLNNQVVGVPEDFYDFLIWKRLTEKPIIQARLIGDILVHYQIDIGDWWYAKRIQYYIDNEVIEIVQDSENKYARLIRKK